jgi:hypothetical protein
MKLSITALLLATTTAILAMPSASAHSRFPFYVFSCTDYPLDSDGIDILIAHEIDSASAFHDNLTRYAAVSGDLMAKRAACYPASLNPCLDSSGSLSCDP